MTALRGPAFFAIGVGVRFAGVVGNALMRQGDTFPILPVFAAQLAFLVVLSLSLVSKASARTRWSAGVLATLGFSFLGAVVLVKTERQLSIPLGAVVQATEIVPSAAVMMATSVAWKRWKAPSLVSDDEPSE